MHSPPLCRLLLPGCYQVKKVQADLEAHSQPKTNSLTLRKMNSMGATGEQTKKTKCLGTGFWQPAGSLKLVIEEARSVAPSTEVLLHKKGRIELRTHLKHFTLCCQCTGHAKVPLVHGGTC